MGNKTLYIQIDTDQPIRLIKEATQQAMRSVGGTIRDDGQGIEILQGTNEVSFAFTANLRAVVNIRDLHPGKKEIECIVSWSPNALFWICLIVGIFVFGILWIIPVLYIFINPTQPYQQALDRISGYVASGAAKVAPPSMAKLLPPKSDLSERLVEAQHLFEKNLISEDEFKELKTKILREP